MTSRKPFKSLKASHTYSNDRLAAIGDNIAPEHSFDEEIPRWTSWPQKGKKQWIEIELEKPTDIRSLSVYWYDDGEHGGVHVPRSWNMEYKTEGGWKPFPLYVTDLYNVFKDQFNMVHPAHALTVAAIRLNVEPQPESCVGILEINIDEDD